jgi:hypothetical protein
LFFRDKSSIIIAYHINKKPLSMIG